MKIKAGLRAVVEKIEAWSTTIETWQALSAIKFAIS